MDKLLIGIVIVVVGGVVGWYTFGNNRSIPGMQIGPNVVSPAPTSASSNTEIYEESKSLGNGKGGIATESVIRYTDSGYTPALVTVKKGAKVTFLNESTKSMWTASGTHPTHQLLPGFDQLKSVTTGGAYEYTFMKVGTWKYHNHVVPLDEGTVVVTD